MITTAISIRSGSSVRPEYNPEPNKETAHLVGVDSKGNAMFTPEGLAHYILDNANIRHPEYKEGDVTLLITPSELAKLAQRVEVIRVDSKDSPSAFYSL